MSDLASSDRADRVKRRPHAHREKTCFRLRPNRRSIKQTIIISDKKSTYGRRTGGPLL